MTKPRLLAGIDLGTTGTRCVVFDQSGRRVASSYAGYGTQRPAAGVVEQSVRTVLDATHDVCRRAVAGCDGRDIVAVGVSAQMSNTCAVDERGEPLAPLISWEDTRAEEEAAWIAERCPPSRFRALTGTSLTAQLVAPTILWLRAHQPELWSRAVVWPQLQGLVLRSLGADGFYLDESEAFAYGLWDVTRAKWNDELLRLTEIEASSLGTPVPAGHPVGTVSETAAERTGLSSGTTICVGAGDQMCALVGMGAIDAGIATSTMGTGGALMATVPEPRTDLRGMTTMNHAVADRWALFAPTLAAASALAWFRDQLGAPEADTADRSGQDPFELLDGLASTSPPGANGTVFLPYLNSAGAPHWNPAASAAFLGLTQATVRADLVRAVLEGVTFEMADNVAALANAGLRPELIRAGGGAARSALWTQIQADVYGIPVQRLRESEVAALGAAALAGVGSGVFASIEQAVESMVHVAETHEPDPATHDRYSELQRTFATSYDALDSEVFERLAAGRAAASPSRQVDSSPTDP